MQQTKHIVITGASSGIGFALVQNYLQQGHKVSACARNIASLQAIQNNTNLLYVAIADVGIETDCNNFISNAILNNGDIDVLINNAGISMRAMFDGINLQVLQNLMNINFWGTVYNTYYALPSIKKTKGVICSVSSIAGYRGLPARTGYSSSKFAMQGFMESLRTELLKTGVHVMWVSPGFTNSNIRNVALGGSGMAQKETPLDEKNLMSAETCAQLIIDKINKRKRTGIFTFQGKITVLLNKLFPSFADKLVYNHFAKEKDSPLQ